MKKLATLFIFLLIMPSAFSQSTAENGRVRLAQYRDPLERFTATIQYLETLDSYASSNIDSVSCLDLLQIAQQLKNDSLLATSYNWIGYYFGVIKGSNATSLDYFFKALPLAEKSKDKRRISSIYFDIAGTFYTLKNIDEFFNYTKKGGQNIPDTNSPKHDYMLIQFQRNMGTYFLETDQLDSALYYAQLADQTSQRLKLPLYKLQTLTLLAITHAKMNEGDLADVYFKKAQLAADSIPLRKEGFYKRYITFLVGAHRWEEAAEQTKIFWDMSLNTQNLNVKLSAAGFKREMFDRQNQIDSAYYYSKVETGLRESIFNRNNQNTIQALAFKEQLRVIEESAARSEEDYQRKQNLQFALIGLSIVTFIILFILLSRSIIVTEKWISFFGILGLLIIFEFINLLIHPFLERATHHSPVLMLLALVALASLLIPMHHKMEKWIKEKMTEKNKKIRLENAKKTLEKLDMRA